MERSSFWLRPKPRCVICGWLLERETGDPKLETRNSKLYSDWCGAVAQLAERRVRNAEARSSTLLCSTNNLAIPTLKTYFRSAKRVEQGGYNQTRENDCSGNQSPPNEAVNHAFRFKIQGAFRTAARIRLEHVPAISTSLCAHPRQDLPLAFPERQSLQFAVKHGMN